MSKVVSLLEAIQKYIHNGGCNHEAGFTDLIPFAAVHEIIRNNSIRKPFIRKQSKNLFPQLAFFRYNLTNSVLIQIMNHPISYYRTY